MMVTVTHRSSGQRMLSREDDLVCGQPPVARPSHAGACHLGLLRAFLLLTGLLRPIFRRGLQRLRADVAHC